MNDNLKKWGVGVALALLPIVYGIFCIATGHALLLGEAGQSLDVYGDAATALGIACIGVGLFIHAEWFMGVDGRLCFASDPLKIGASIVVTGSIVFAIFKILG